MRIGIPAFLWIALGGLFLSCTIVKNDQANTRQMASEDRAFALSAKDSTFDPKQYADAIWEPVVLPRVESLSVEYKSLLEGLQADEQTASQTLGYRLLEEGNHYNFAVKGTVKLLAIDTSSMNGTAALDFAPFDGQKDCLMSIGPIFRGSTLRDIQNTISLNNFSNQVEFARLARELNNKVRDMVLAKVDFSQRIGTEAELLGVFTYEGRGSVIEIIPVRLTFLGE